MIFNEMQIKTLQAALDRLIPADDYPGAWEAGVGDYILRQLTGDLASLQPSYTEGLDALNAEAHARAGTPFHALEHDDQDDLLRNLEAGTVITPWPVPPERFFSLLLHHAAEGYYADPDNGGNRNARSWQMIGFVIEEGVRR